MITRRLIVVPVDPAEIRSEFCRFLSQARNSGWTGLRVRFGFAWEETAEGNGNIEETMTPDELAERVDFAEAAGRGKLGEDDLYVTPLATGVEHLFCHDADIHLRGPGDSGYLESEATRYASLGWTVYESVKSEGENCHGKVQRFEPGQESR